MRRDRLRDLLGDTDLLLLDQVLRGRLGPRTPPYRVLDAGGNGEHRDLFRQAGYRLRVVGPVVPRISPEGFVRARMEALPLADGSFDVVLFVACAAVAFSRPEFDGVLTELGRVLRPGGLLIARVNAGLGEDGLRAAEVALDLERVDPLATTAVEGEAPTIAWVARRRGGTGRGHVALHCLRCFHPLEGIATGVAHCSACGFTTLPSDRRTYWNRSPRLRAVETMLKIGIILLTAFLCASIAVVSGASTKAGFAAATPIFLGIVLWVTASKLTKHLPEWRMDIFWPAFILLLCLFAWIFDEQFGLTTVRLLLVNCGLVLLAGLALWWARAFDRWKHRKTGHPIRQAAGER